MGIENRPLMRIHSPGGDIRYGLWFRFSAMTAYPFVIGGLVHNPLVRTAIATVVEQGFRSWVGCGVCIPQGYQLVGISVDCPAAVAYDSGSPVTDFLMVDAFPVMLASGRFCRLGRCLCCGRFRFRRQGFGRLRFRGLCFRRFGWFSGRWICGIGGRLGGFGCRGICRFGFFLLVAGVFLGFLRLCRLCFLGCFCGFRWIGHLRGLGRAGCFGRFGLWYIRFR